MAGTKISNLPVIVSPALTDIFPEVQPAVGGITYKATFQQLLNLYKTTIVTPANGGIVYTDASQVQLLAPTATANQMLQSGANVAPHWSSATWPATTTINQLLWSSAANQVVGLATANNGVLITSAGGVPSISSTLPAAVQANITQVGAALFNNVSIQVITATGTYTPTSGMLYCIVEIVGGGAGGGGAASSAAQAGQAGGGGGAGGCRKIYSAAQIGATAAVVIGTGGAGGTAGNTNGSSGVASTFTPSGGGAVLTANPGTFGRGSAATSSVSSAEGGTGGTGTGGDVNFSGGNGEGGVVVSGVDGVVTGGCGGSSFLCNQQNNRLDTGATANAVNYGGGGVGGKGNNNIDVAGGNGSPGVCIITEFCKV